MSRLSITNKAYLANGLFVALAAAASSLLFVLGRAWLFSGVTFIVIGSGVAILGVVSVLASSPAQRLLSPAKANLRLVLVLWWSVLSSEELFFRISEQEEANAGRFAIEAYGEAAFWVLAFVVFFLVARRQYLRRFFNGDNKWMSLFAAVCILSAPLAPQPLYSLAWGFKLFLVICLLVYFSTTIQDEADIEAFYWSNFWGFCVVSVLPVLRACFNPAGPFEEGRLRASANSLAITAGIVLLLALLLNSVRPAPWLKGFALLGAAMMIVSGGKAGIIAGVVSVTVFFALQGRLAAGAGWLMGLIVVGGVILVTTPLASHFMSYSEEGHAANLTGRTDLWAALWPEILRYPIAGHGYVASRFLSEIVQGGDVFQAAHTHNSFLEVSYNNGFIGLFVLMAIITVLVRNLRRSLGRLPNGRCRNLTVGAWALFVCLLINGLGHDSFGGSAGSPFMLLLGLFVISGKLREMAEKGNPGDRVRAAASR
jgi:O-antigen ligase